jgi:hypothetical protein
MSTRLKIFIIGGYGIFGGRLAALLADEPRLTLVIAGRSRAKAEAFCAGLPVKGAIVPSVFDREGDVESQLREAAPDIVVDASGPFQDYADPYRVVRACVALGINYLDLADGSDFVKGVAHFDQEATARGVFVLAGVSSFPVLTAAVVRRLSTGMVRIEAVTGGIAPSPFANVGQNVIRAIASYAGKPIDLGPGLRRHALVDARRTTVAPPGRMPLRPIRFSLVDVPDIQVLPELWPSLRRVWMGAGPVPEVWHRALNACAQLVRFRILPSLSFLAPVIYRAINVLSWGEHRGGMFVSVEGRDRNDQRVERSWHMIAERDDGPFIPSMAAEAIVRHCLDGRRPKEGARPATTELELADYDALFARRQIFTGFREPLHRDAPLYRHMLGDVFDTLPEPWQRMHELTGALVAEGVAQVDRGTNWLSRLGGWIMGFPKAGKDVPVRVDFRREGAAERWQRTFDGEVFASTQEQGRGRFEGLICERFGLLAFGLALVVEGERMNLVVRRWTCFGVPLPVALAPQGDAYEYVVDGRFCFHVEIGHPLTGLIVRYRGWLVPRT